MVNTHHLLPIPLRFSQNLFSAQMMVDCPAFWRLSEVGSITELVPEGQDDTRERLSPGHVSAPCSRSHQPHRLKTKRGVTVTEVCEDDKTEARCRQLYAENTRLRQLCLCHCCSTTPFYAVLLPCKHFVCFPCMCCMWPLCPLHKCHRRVEMHVLVRFE